jgi:hypothetical protein
MFYKQNKIFLYIDLISIIKDNYETGNKSTIYWRVCE